MRGIIFQSFSLPLERIILYAATSDNSETANICIGRLAEHSPR